MEFFKEEFNCHIKQSLHVMSIKRWKSEFDFEMSMKTLVIYVVNAQQLLSLGLIYFIVISTMLIDKSIATLRTIKAARFTKHLAMFSLRG